MSDEVVYRGYRLSAKRHGSVGWKVFIYRPYDVVALEKIPHNEAPESREAVMEEAKLVVDQHLKRRR